MIKELIILYPKTSVVFFSLLVTLAMTLVTKYFTKQDRIKELKKIQKACQIKIKEKKGEPEEQAKIQKEMFACSMELFKHSMRPMFYTFLPLILFFMWVRGMYLETSIAGTWLWWYIGTGVGSSIILRKVLDVA